MGEIITYESLYEIVRKEKTSQAVQQVNSTIMEQISQYLKTKLQVYKEAKENSLPDIEKIRTQVLSARRLIKNFYELRERKVVNLAVAKSRAKSELEEEENLLDHEKKLMKELVENIDKYRHEVLLNLVNAKYHHNKEEPINEKQDIKEPGEQQQAAETEQTQTKSGAVTAMIRFTAEVPKFLGKQKEIYGPFRPGDIANLDKDIVDILIKKNAAELIQSQLS